MTVRDLQLDPGGDLTVTSGDLVLVSDLPAIAQDLRQAYQFFHGEDPVAPDEGFPWFESVLGKNPDAGVLRQVFVEQGEARPGVKTVTQLQLAYDRNLRKLNVGVSASTDLGELATTSAIVPVP
jgi:hypothetical protein